MPTEADRMLTRFRDWVYRRTGGGVRWGKASLQSGLPHRLPPNELFSVYNEHTKSCSVCQRAVKRFQAIRAVFAVSAYKIRVKRAPSSKSFATLTKHGGLNSVVVMIPEAVFLAAYLESTQN